MVRETFRAALDGAQLDELDSRIYIEDISENIKLAVETMKRARNGQWLVSAPDHDELEVKITLMIKARQPEERMDVIEKIMGWATSGYLTVSTRPGLRLYVICTQPPSVAAFDWTERLEIVLSGYGDACWEEIYPATVTAENQTAWTGTIKPGGTRSCYLEYLVTNKASANLTSVTATANGYTIAVTGITVAQGGKVWLHYDQHHFLYILTGATMQTPLVSYRTAASADDILLTPGVSNSFTLTTDVSCDMEVTARGMWR